MDDIIVFTGGFDPIHSGHIEAIKEARQLGRVIIGLNSDEWLVRKKGKAFLEFNERRAIIEQFKDVLCVIGFDDSDNTACDAIRQAREMFPKSKIIFVNGGDRTSTNIPEMDAFKDDSMVEFKFGVGGDYKKNSSSTILQNWAFDTVERVWGKYTTYYKNDNGTLKIKRLVVDPGKSLSMQRHSKRSEVWFVEEGVATVVGEDHKFTVDKYQGAHINCEEWHQLQNNTDSTLAIVEIQYGEYCDESDIERR